MAALQAVLVGLNRRRVLEDAFTHGEAASVLDVVVAALGVAERGPRGPR